MKGKNVKNLYRLKASIVAREQLQEEETDN